MSQGVKEEVLAPSCFESFDPGGGLIGSHLENIGGQASQQCKISWTVLLSISCEIFVKDHVLLPMAAVFDIPMTSNDLKKIRRREAARRDVVVLLITGFPINGTFADNPSRCDETFEVMFVRKTWRGNDDEE